MSTEDEEQYYLVYVGINAKDRGDAMDKVRRLIRDTDMTIEGAELEEDA